MIFAMRTEPRATSPSKAGDADDETRHREQLLDEALANTFPASDPLRSRCHDTRLKGNRTTGQRAA